MPLADIFTRPPDVSGDAPWVNMLKQLVQRGIDPRMLLQPPDANTDPGLNRQGPQIGEQPLV